MILKRILSTPRFGYKLQIFQNLFSLYLNNRAVSSIWWITVQGLRISSLRKEGNVSYAISLLSLNRISMYILYKSLQVSVSLRTSKSEILYFAPERSRIQNNTFCANCLELVSGQLEFGDRCRSLGVNMSRSHAPVNYFSGYFTRIIMKISLGVENGSNITLSHPRDRFYRIREQEMIQVFVTASRKIF